MSIEHRNTIYLVRHGENPANITHEFSYKYVDYSLTPKGALQAEQTAEWFQDKNIDAIYSSPLKRARETADPISRLCRLPVTIIEDFREVNVGSLEGRPPTDENWLLHNRIVQDWVDGKYTSTFPDGEDFISLTHRLRSGLLEVTRNQQGKRIVVVGHGGIFTRTMKEICPEVNLEKVLRAGNHNCSITEIELKTKGSEVVGTLKVWASYAHLHGEAAKVLPASFYVENVPVSEIP